MRKKGLPKRNELVICKITRINPHSAVATLLEYDKTGLIHVSEVASRWVRNIKEFLKENQHVVCRVMDVREGQISLSVKRVYKEDSTKKLNEFKRERRSEKLLEMAGRNIKKNLEETYNEIGEIILEEFGSLTKMFEVSLKSPELLRKKGLPDKWVDAIVDIAKKNYADKTFVVKGNLKLVSYDPDGVEQIRSTLLGAKKQGFDVHYVSAPKYVISLSGKNYKETESRLHAQGESIVKQFGKHGEASFEIEK